MVVVAVVEVVAVVMVMVVAAEWWEGEGGETSSSDNRASSQTPGTRAAVAAAKPQTPSRRRDRASFVTRHAQLDLRCGARRMVGGPAGFLQSTFNNPNIWITNNIRPLQVSECKLWKIYHVPNALIPLAG